MFDSKAMLYMMNNPVIEYHIVKTSEHGKDTLEKCLKKLFGNRVEVVQTNPIRIKAEVLEGFIVIGYVNQKFVEV